MKSVINILLLGACFLCAPAFARLDPDSFSLKVEGRVLNAGANGASCMIELYCDEMRVDSFELNHPKRKFSFNLLKNRNYSIRLKQKGFIDKVVVINTEIPYFQEDAYGFFFETSLLNAKDMAKISKDVLSMPVARIFFDSKRGYFYYDRAYSENIRREMLARYVRYDRR